MSNPVAKQNYFKIVTLSTCTCKLVKLELLNALGFVTQKLYRAKIVPPGTIFATKIVPPGTIFATKIVPRAVQFWLRKMYRCHRHMHVGPPPPPPPPPILGPGGPICLGNWVPPPPPPPPPGPKCRKVTLEITLGY